MSSPHQYGVLSLEDVPFLENIVLPKVITEHSVIIMLELGVAGGGTTRGVKQYCENKGWPFRWWGIDQAIGKPEFPLGEWGTFVEGDMHHDETRNRIADICFNLLFIDGCHCYECCTKDFMMYEGLVDSRGFVLFHDTVSAPQWQNHHIQCKPDRFIETRRALKDLGLSPLTAPGYKLIGDQNCGTTQGMMLFQKS